MKEKPVILNFGKTLIHFGAISHINLNNIDKTATIFVIGRTEPLISNDAQAYSFFTNDNVGWFESVKLA